MGQNRRMPGKATCGEACQYNFLVVESQRTGLAAEHSGEEVPTIVVSKTGIRLKRARAPILAGAMLAHQYQEPGLPNGIVL
jgi:hypothetical protein